MASLRKGKDWSRPDLASVGAAIKITDTFGGSMNYLVGEGINTSFDIITFNQVQAIQGIKRDIDSVIREHKTLRAFTN
jgi:hypothetical protein